MKRATELIFLSYIILGTACFPRDSASIPIENMSVTPLIDISGLNANIAKIPLLLANIYSVDESNSIYLLDVHDHRILKYDNTGGFQAQIGRIGQDKEGLISPVGLFVSKGLLYVLNEGGQEIKIFSTDGGYRSSFRIENAWQSNSICVVGDLICVNVIEKKQPAKYKGGVISVYSHDGRLVRTIGKTVECNSLVGYSVFNRVIMATAEGRLFWAFANLPFLGCEGQKNTKGWEFFDLKELRLPEISRRTEYIKAYGLATPETKKPDTDLQINLTNYCAGFGIDRNMNMYYVTREYSQEPGRGGMECHLLVLGKNEKVEKRIVLQHDGGNLMVSHLLFGPGDSRYGLGKIKGKTLLFKF